MIGWLVHNVWWLTAGSIILSVSGLFVGLMVVLRLPADYFLHDTRQPVLASSRHPLLRILLLVLKNIAGVLMLILGIIMAVPMIPGPGLIFMLMAVSLLDIPGKYAAERYLIHRPFVLHSINTLRTRWNRPPLVAPKKTA